MLNNVNRRVVGSQNRASSHPVAVYICKYICKQEDSCSRSAAFPINSVTFAQILDSHDS